jgi:nucleoside 2-deoxyribosyltransferase
MSATDSEGCRRARVYLAAPLFSEAERTFNVRVTELLEELMDVYLPQRDGGLISDMVRAGMASTEAARRVFRDDMHAIRRADCIIAVLDGRAIDEGVAFELGVAFSHKKPCIGLQTDSRRLAAWGNNPMITGALDAVFMSVDDLMDWARTKALVDDASPSKDSEPGSTAVPKLHAFVPR